MEQASVSVRSGTSARFAGQDLRELSFADLALLCENAPDTEGGFDSERDFLIWCASRAVQSPVAYALMRFAGACGWDVSLADLSSGGFALDVPARVCRIDHHALAPCALGRSPYFRHAVFMSFVRALRDIWHEELFGAFEHRYSPEDVLKLERLRAADGDVISIHAAWELRSAGHPEIWRHVIGSAEGDMALAFAHMLEKDPAAQFDGRALAEMFRQWYAEECRVNACDHDTLESLDDVLHARGNHALSGKNRIAGDVAEDIARLPDGQSYLEGLGEIVLRDVFFAGMSDPVNQAHLLHIQRDIESVRVHAVSFRDPVLAQRMFPQEGRALS